MTSLFCSSASAFLLPLLQASRPPLAYLTRGRKFGDDHVASGNPASCRIWRRAIPPVYALDIDFHLVYFIRRKSNCLRISRVYCSKIFCSKYLFTIDVKNRHVVYHICIQSLARKSV